MCEFFYIQARGGQVGHEPLRSLLAAAEAAGPDNPHGTGVFDAQGRALRTETVLDVDLADSIAHWFADSQRVVVHLREATCGRRDRTNVHPFRCDGLTLAHNGHVTGVDAYGEPGDADSRRFLEKVADHSGSTLARIQAATATTAGDLSVFLLDEAGDLYYFRDGRPLHFVERPDHVVGVTRLGRLPGTPDAWQPTPGVVYRIEDRPLPVGGFWLSE